MRDEFPIDFWKCHSKEEIYEWMFKALSEFGPVSDELKLAIKSCTVLRFLRKNKVIMGAKEVCSCCYFSYTGYVKGYSIRNGRQHIEWFMGPGSIIIRPESFHQRELSDGWVAVIEDMVAIELSYENFAFLKQKFPEFRDINENAVNYYYTLSLERGKMKDRTGEENLDVLLVLHPKILSIASSVDVASYLGITREGLAKIRRKTGL